ncbi:hypothetical protein GCM10022236_42520 [Microlunatus ginsengisoli]|uniref:Uncharacterized protein n=1 Tax=Microlunatus ginsengisoli TaxID=363863 RepID=A0ABP7AMC7_9ACTN
MLPARTDSFHSDLNASSASTSTSGTSRVRIRSSSDMDWTLTTGTDSGETFEPTPFAGGLRADLSPPLEDP